jgi:hypothetical protein
LASGNGAHVELDGAVISGGKLQTLAGGEIDANNGRAQRCDNSIGLDR